MTAVGQGVEHRDSASIAQLQEAFVSSRAECDGVDHSAEDAGGIR